MASKVDDAKIYFDGKDDQFVKDTYLAAHDSVNVSECYGTRDVMMLLLAENELIRRGYFINLIPKVVIEKE